MIQFYKTLSPLLTTKDKRFMILLLLLSICISVIETIGVAAIMPFISIASDFSVIHSNEYYKYFYDYFSFESDISFVLIFGVLLIGFYFFRSTINLFYFYMLAKFSSARYHIFAIRLFKNYLGRSYKNFIDDNSANLSKAIVIEASYLTKILSSLLFIFSEIFIILFICSMMIYMDWKITLLLFILLAVSSFILVNTISKKIKKVGNIREKSQKSFYEILNSTFGNYKMIKLKSENSKIVKKFSDYSNEYAKSNIINDTLNNAPRLFLEALGFIIVVFIIVYLIYTNQHDISSSMAIISMFILGLYRLMPSANRILSSYNQILYYYKSLDIVHDNIMHKIESLGDEVIIFDKTIKLKSISFSYVNDKEVLSDISLTIQKGSKIAFVGESGSGKSTLVDIIMGLHKPLSGGIYIDDVLLDNSNIKNWRKRIGYIPQQIYLFDGTVAQNVALDEEYDESIVRDVLKKANLLDFLELHHDGIYTKVGENGLKLSGGQKQRVAIARALYNDPEVLILDEATSALDSDTEVKIMDEIYNISEDKTLIVIAHRLSTIERCEVVYNLEQGKIK